MTLGIYTAAAWTANGGLQVAAGATVEVRTYATGQPLAAIKADRDGATAKDNPFTADAQGRFAFFAPGGAYRIKVKDGAFEQVLEYQAVGTGGEADIDTPGSLLTTGNLAANGGTVPEEDRRNIFAPSSVAGATYRAQASVVFEKDGPNEVQIISSSTGYGQLRFGDGDSDFRGAISYDHDVDSFRLFTAGTSRGFINSDGGIEWGGPTGGSQGEGTINAQAVYENGNRVLTDEDVSGADVLGRDQKWQDMTASRSISTIYTNTTGKPIAVNVHSINNNDGDNSNFVIEVSEDGSAWVVVGFDRTRSGQNDQSLFGIVPNNHQYRWRRDTGNNTAAESDFTWSELR